jgi:shikimate kinase
MLTVPIFLTGFMATGKSRIGRVLAAQLSRPFFDTDEMIEQRAGKKIPEIFDEDGEDSFRRWESECVETAAQRPDAVVALGGGAITRAQNRELIGAASALLVCVEADVETILERVSRRDDRPLLAGLTADQRRRKIVDMLAERAPYYSSADITVRTTESTTVEEVVAGLVTRLQQVPS